MLASAAVERLEPLDLQHENASTSPNIHGSKGLFNWERNTVNVQTKRLCI